MIDRAWAEDFAHDWAASWNARDVEAVLAHFSPDVVFRSPRIAVVHGAGRMSVTGLAALRDYWQKALAAVPDVHFEVLKVGVGADALTIYYRNQRGTEIAETLVFGEDGKAIAGVVTHFDFVSPAAARGGSAAPGACAAGKNCATLRDRVAGVRGASNGEKLKVYRTSMRVLRFGGGGPSMKAAAEAWGSDPDIFRRGFARRPQIPRWWPRRWPRPALCCGGRSDRKAEFSERAALPKAPEGERKAAPPRGECAQPAERPVAKPTKAKQAAAREQEQAAAREKERERQERERQGG